jgi:hypothetical protein
MLIIFFLDTVVLQSNRQGGWRVTQISDSTFRQPRIFCVMAEKISTNSTEIWQKMSFFCVGTSIFGVTNCLKNSTNTRVTSINIPHRQVLAWRVTVDLIVIVHTGWTIQIFQSKYWCKTWFIFHTFFAGNVSEIFIDFQSFCGFTEKLLIFSPKY